MLFLVVLFLLRNGLLFKNTVAFIQGNQNSGLAYDANITVGDLVNKDTDGDGVPDWEETLYGLDPTKRETTPGIPDSTAIAKMKVVQGNTEQGLPSLNETQNLTQTDKFSRELFSTVAALNQNGNVDQATVDQIGSSLADHIKNSPQRKIYALTDIKIINNDLYATIKNYADTLNSIYKKNPTDLSVIDILQKFIIDGNNVDTSVLVELDPVIKQIQGIIDNMAKMSVPESLASLHLDLLNGLQKVVENLNDIQLYETDPIVALSGINQYETNATALDSIGKNLLDILSQKLNN